MSPPPAEKTVRRDYGIEIGIGMVDIVVGAEKTLFRVHKNLLCSRAPVFDKMFNGKFPEADSQKAELPEEPAVVFSNFVEWLYTTRVPRMTDVAEMEDPSWVYIKLYCFAEKYCLPDLADEVMTAFLEYARASNKVPNCGQMQHAYQNTSESSPMRRFIVLTLQFVVLATSRHAGLTSEQLTQLLSNTKDLGFDYFEAIQGSNGVKVSNPSNGNLCDFHVHANGVVCSTQKV